MSWLATPTPMTEPIMVWELEAGRPLSQVARFQMMAAMSRAKTMAKPEPLETFEDELDGKEDDDGEGDDAGAEQDADEVEDAGVDDGDVGLEGVGVDDGGDGVGGVVEAVDELEGEGDEEGDAEQDVGEDAGGVDDGEVDGKAVADVDQAERGHDGEDEDANYAEGGFFNLASRSEPVGSARAAIGREGRGSCGH